MPRDQETHTCHLTPPVYTRRHLDLLRAENRISVCHQRLSPFPHRRPKRQHAHTKPFISRPPCWKHQVWKINSVTQARRPQGWACEGRENLPLVHSAGREDPTPGRTLQDRSRCRKKVSSTRLPCPLRRSNGNIYSFIEVSDSTRISIIYEPEVPARVQRPRCAVPGALLVAMDGGCAPAVKYRVR